MRHHCSHEQIVVHWVRLRLGRIAKEERGGQKRLMPISRGRGNFTRFEELNRRDGSQVGTCSSVPTCMQLGTENFISCWRRPRKTKFEVLRPSFNRLCHGFHSRLYISKHRRNRNRFCSTEAQQYGSTLDSHLPLPNYRANHMQCNGKALRPRNDLHWCAYQRSHIIGQMSGNRLVLLQVSVCMAIHIHPRHHYYHTRYGSVLVSYKPSRTLPDALHSRYTSHPPLSVLRSILVLGSFAIGLIAMVSFGHCTLLAKFTTRP